jgi:hypothetical protein
MVAETLATEQTWRCLWSKAAHDIIASLCSTTSCDCVHVGSSWGFRNHANHRLALLLHPSGNGREIGDLALTVLGHGTHVIPRYAYGFPEYLDEVASIVETTTRVYLELAVPKATD